MKKKTRKEGGVSGSFAAGCKVVLLLAAFLTFTAYGEDGTNITGNFYITKVDVPVLQYDIFSGVVQDTSILKTAAQKAKEYELRARQLERKAKELNEKIKVLEKGSEDDTQKIASEIQKKKDQARDLNDRANIFIQMAEKWKANVGKEGENNGSGVTHVAKGDPNIFYVARAGTKFTAIETRNGNVIIKFWRFIDTTKKDNKSDKLGKPEEDSTNKAQKEYKYIGFENNNMYFAMPVDDFNSKVQPYYGRNNSFVWGITSVPIKLRFGGKNRPFSYSSNFSLGFSAGYEHSYESSSDQAISVLAGVAISSVSVDSATTNGYVANSTYVGAFTPSIAVVYTYERFQVGLFWGWDLIAGNLRSKWVYKNSTWLGIGLGFALFEKNKKPKDTNQNQ